MSSRLSHPPSLVVKDIFPLYTLWMIEVGERNKKAIHFIAMTCWKLLLFILEILSEAPTKVAGFYVFLPVNRLKRHHSSGVSASPSPRWPASQQTSTGMA